MKSSPVVAKFSDLGPRLDDIRHLQEDDTLASSDGLHVLQRHRVGQGEAAIIHAVAGDIQRNGAGIGQLKPVGSSRSVGHDLGDLQTLGGECLHACKSE